MGVEAKMKKKKEMQKLFLENERNEKSGTVNLRRLRHIMSGKDIPALY